MYVITYFDRNKGRGVEKKFPTHAAAMKAASRIFDKLGLVVGIEWRPSHV